MAKAVAELFLKLFSNPAILLSYGSQRKPTDTGISQEKQFSKQ